jgi:aspartate aminotransferase
LLSDEIYGELDFKGRHLSIARYYPEGTIISSGLSKWCGAGGWRLGTFVFPESLGWLLEAMATVASESFTSTSAPIQYAAVRAFRGGLRIERYLWQSRRILRALGETLWQRLQAAGLNVARPVGGFYLFPDATPLRERLAARDICDSESLCQRLLEDTGVAILPGSVFGRPPEELTARIAFVDFDGARALAAAEQIAADGELGGDFLEMWCGRMLTAIDRLCQWLNGAG